jgi:hypothetical protein
MLLVYPIRPSRREELNGILNRHVQLLVHVATYQVPRPIKPMCAVHPCRRIVLVAAALSGVAQHVHASLDASKASMRRLLGNEE